MTIKNATSNKTITRLRRTTTVVFLTSGLFVLFSFVCLFYSTQKKALRIKDLEENLKLVTTEKIKLKNAIDTLLVYDRKNDTITFIKIISKYLDNQQLVDTVAIIPKTNQNYTPRQDSLNNLNSLSRTTPTSTIFEKYKALYFGGSKSFDSLNYKDKNGCLIHIKMDVGRLNVSFNAKEIWGGDLSSSFYHSVKCPGDSQRESSEMLSWKPRQMKIVSDSLFINYYKNDSFKTNFSSGKFLFDVHFRGKISESSISGQLVWTGNSSTEKHKIISDFNIPLQSKIER
jgi:hypothetical protein